MVRSSIAGAIYLYSSLALGLVGYSLVGMAQQAVPSRLGERAQESPSGIEHSTGPVLPAPLNGLNPRLTAAIDNEGGPNQLTGSVGLNGLYTDNAFTSGLKAIGDYQYSVLAGLGFRTFAPRTQWRLNYAGGFTIDQRSSGNSQQAHDGTLDVRHDFTRRLSAEARQDYTMTNNPFARIGTSESLPAVTGPGELSPLTIPSPVTRIGSISTASITYALARHSAIGTSGSFSLLNFHDDEKLVGSRGALIDTTNTAGRVFYLRQISPRHTIGAEYQLQDLRFNGGVARTLDQTVFLFDGISFKGDMTLSLYAGPESTHTHNAVVARPNLAPEVFLRINEVWSLGGGVAYAWRGKRNGLRLSGERGMSDGGGWSGAVRLNTARLELERALSPRWSTTLDLAYSDGRTLEVPLELGRITTEEAGFGFSWRLTSGWTAFAQYGRIQQPHAAQFTQTLLKNHNQVQAGLTYEFQKVFSK